MRTRWIVALILGLLLAACSHGEADREDGHDRPQQAATRTAEDTRTAEPTRTAPPETANNDPVRPAAVTRDAARPSPRSAVGTAAPSLTEVRLFFVRGEQVESVTRRVRSTPRIGGAALDALLAGPTPQEAAREYANLIPRGTQVRSLSIDDGTASLDLTGHFLQEDDGYFMALRFAQVACTLTQFPTVDGVRITIDGARVDVPTSSTMAARHPVECLDYAEMVPTSAIGARAGT